MKLITVSTGSDQGNCYLLESNGRYVALDCGAKWKDVLVACGFAVYGIKAAFLSHRHKDHSAHARDFIKSGIPVYTNAESAKKLNGSSICRANKKEVYWNNDWFIPFEVPHTDNDGDTPCQNYAYIIQFNGERILYLTDWMYCPFNLAKFNINHFIIAINYSDEISEHHVLNGHSSLGTAVKFLKSSMTDACRSISICHVSERHADPDLILETINELANGKEYLESMKRKNEIDDCLNGTIVSENELDKLINELFEVEKKIEATQKVNVNICHKGEVISL